MTTVQESPNGHLPLPPPCSLPDLPDHLRSKDSSDNNSNPDSAPAPATSETETFAANADHVPPRRYAPRANAYQFDDYASAKVDTSPLPERCQFMFSDGRQCTMARSDIHPSLCRFHSEREEQLFGDPAPGGHVVGAALDLPELHSACRDLTTAAGVNRALGQVFRLLAQRRISRQEAATFGDLAQLLLQTIRPARMDVPSEQRESGDLSASARGNKVTAAGPHSDSSGLRPPAAGPVDVPPAPRADSSREATEGRNPRTINTSAAFVSNSSEINTSENAESEAVQNEHLQKSGPGGHRRERHPRRERLPTG